MSRSTLPSLLATPLTALCILLAACSNSTPSGACTTAPPSGGPEFVGTVDFGSSGSSSGPIYTVDATFYPNYGAAQISTVCPGTQIGSCCFTPTAPACSLPDPISAGVLTASDGSTQLGQLTFTVGMGYGDLDSLAQSNVVWQPGDTLNIGGAGQSAMAAAFNTSVVATAALANITPAIDNASLTIPKADDFTVTWTPGAGSALVQLFLEDVSLQGISCTAPVTAGTITVPKALLQMFGPGGSLSIEAYNQTILTGTNAAVFVYADAVGGVGQATYP